MFLPIRKTPGLGLFLARSLSLGFLTLHAAWYLDGTVKLLPGVLLFLFSLGAAVFLEQRRLRFFPALVLFAGFLALGRLCLFLVFRLYQFRAASPAADFLFFRFDSSFLPMLLPAFTVWSLTFLSRRFITFIPWECGIHTLLFAGLFWSQGGFDIDIYPHPALLALAATVFILLQGVILYKTVRPGSRNAGKMSGRFRSLFWIFVPVLLLFLLFMYNWYTREAVTHGGGLIKPTFFRFDFSRYVRLESEISLSDDLVILVRKEGGGNSALLRRFILSGYREQEGFFFEPEPGSRGFRTVVPDTPVTLYDPGYQGREDVLQEYYIINFDPSSLLSIEYPVSVVPLVNWDTSSFLRVYRVHSRGAGFFPMELSESPDPEKVMDETLYSYYTGYGGDEAIRRLALEVTADAEIYYDRVTAIERYLLDNYYYSLKPGVAADGNQLHHFLFESEKGYCSYFAFAMALMARSVGIPARVAVGFFTDPASEIFNYYPVRADMAHAWVEVFFPDYGWIEFDPTSTVIAPGEEYQFGGMDMQEVSRLIEEILKNRYQLREEEGMEEEEDLPVLWFQRTLEGVKRLLSLWYLILPGFYLILCFAYRLVYTLKRFLTRGEANRAVMLYREAAFTLRCLGAGQRGNETVSEYARRLDQRFHLSMEALAEVYLKALFSPDFEAPDLSEARQYHRALKVAIRRAFSFPARAAGFLNPFGFRGRRL